MSQLSTDQSTQVPDSSQYNALERSVINSALWAAAGDALGWMTELVRGPADVRHRTGVSRVSEPVDWKRLIGGRNGPKVSLPAGTYSDDTQLRLAVSRSIRGNGSFDVEAFAKIELTVWPSYALGGGLGTKAAALNLSRRGVNWFSNFYERGNQVYVKGGGNGAAMRVQPHVWASNGTSSDFILNVIRDSLVTHGHPHGFCGAVFHALGLADTLKTGEIPPLESWKKYILQFKDLPGIILNDSQLAAFWLPAWEENSGVSLEVALEKTMTEALNDLDVVAKLLSGAFLPSYHTILEKIGCLTPQYRGSGFKTALAALALSHIYRDGAVEEALIVSANELDSDTDTIATMAGALLGAISSHPPGWKIQDREYIISEAFRLARIAQGYPQKSFTYPDLGRWNPPTNQTASVGLVHDGFAILGLGKLSSVSEEFSAGDSIWQWHMLPFGQTILAKRRSEVKVSIRPDQLPGSPRADALKPRVIDAKTPRFESSDQPSLLLEIPVETRSAPKPASSPEMPQSSYVSIDVLTDAIISSNFDDLTLGKLLNRFIDSSQSIESTIGFVAIIAKAKLARQKRQR